MASAIPCHIAMVLLIVAHVIPVVNLKQCNTKIQEWAQVVQQDLERRLQKHKLQKGKNIPWIFQRLFRSFQIGLEVSGCNLLEDFSGFEKYSGDSLLALEVLEVKCSAE